MLCLVSVTTSAPNAKPVANAAMSLRLSSKATNRCARIVRAAAVCADLGRGIDFLLVTLWQKSDGGFEIDRRHSRHRVSDGARKVSAFRSLQPTDT